MHIRKFVMSSGVDETNLPQVLCTQSHLKTLCLITFEDVMAPSDFRTFLFPTQLQI